MQNRETAEEFINFAVSIKNYLRTQMKAEGDSLTEQQFRTLIYLRKLNRCTLKELSESVSISNSSMCIMLSKLYDDNLIIRENDIEDRRNTFFSLSEQGNKYLDAAMERKLNLIETKINKLSEERKTALVGCIKELENIIDELK